MNNNAAEITRPFVRNGTMTFLDAHLLCQIDEALKKVGDFGEVRLVVMKGRLRFIQIVRSEAVDESGGAV